MIASDLACTVVALGFVLTLVSRQTWLLYFLSALLTFATPFFQSGRLAILPRRECDGTGRTRSIESRAVTSLAFTADSCLHRRPRSYNNWFAGYYDLELLHRR